MKPFLLLLTAVLSFPTFAKPTKHDSALPVLVICGMKQEADLLTGTDIATVISAGNPAQLRAALQNYSASNVRAVISFGIAGGLDPGLKPGDVVIASSVVTGTSAANLTHWTATPSVVSNLTQSYTGVGISLASGTAAGEDNVVAVDPPSRAALFQATGAGIVDQESHIAAEFATANGLPFGVVRAVADPASFTMPPAALLPLNSDGTPNNSAIYSSIAAHPSQISSLLKLNNYNNSALNALAACNQALSFGDLCAKDLVLRAAAAVAGSGRPAQRH